jgi:hypothetical protein
LTHVAELMAEAQAICEELGVDADIASTTGIPPTDFPR